MGMPARLAVFLAPPVLLRGAPCQPRAPHDPPPSLNEAYAAAHDAAVWGTLQACLGEPAEDVACPAGRVWLAQAVRTAPAAYWAAWADALPVLAACSPAFAARAPSGEHVSGASACLRAAAERRSLLVAEGWSEPPAWDELARGAAPRAAEADADIELGEWRPGWQRQASGTRDLFFRDHVLLPSLPPASHAMLRSQAGPHAGAWLTAIPSDPHTSLKGMWCPSKMARTHHRAWRRFR